MSLCELSTDAAGPDLPSNQPCPWRRALPPRGWTVKHGKLYFCCWWGEVGQTRIAARAACSHPGLNALAIRNSAPFRPALRRRPPSLPKRSSCRRPDHVPHARVLEFACFAPHVTDSTSFVGARALHPVGEPGAHTARGVGASGSGGTTPVGSESWERDWPWLVMVALCSTGAKYVRAARS